MTAAPPLVLIAAVARNGVIGRDGGMPWRLPGDMAHFKTTTMGHPVIMGRRTYASIGRALPGRSVVVLSRDPGFRPSDAMAVTDLEAAIDAARHLAGRAGASSVFVAGGGAVYAATMPFAQLLLVTDVDAAPDGDTRFPRIDPADWAETDRAAAPAHEGDTAPYAFVRYERRPESDRPARV